MISLGGTRLTKPLTEYLSSIFEFNIVEGKWYTQSYHMSRPREHFGISVVDFKYYSDACNGSGPKPK